jgi:hypothetical protein
VREGGEAGGRRRAVALIAGLASVALGFSLSSAVSRGVGWTEAAWTDAEVAAATVSAGRLYAPSGLSCVAAGGLLAVAIEFTWTAPPTAAGGVAPDGYVLVATTGSLVQSYAIPAGQTRGSISAGVLSLLTATTVSVYATKGAWVSPVATQTRTVTAVAGLLGLIVAWGCT